MCESPTKEKLIQKLREYKRAYYLTKRYGIKKYHIETKEKEMKSKGDKQTSIIKVAVKMRNRIRYAFKFQNVRN